MLRFGRPQAPLWLSRAKGQSNFPLTGLVATTAIWTSRPSQMARLARRHVKPTTSAAPGPMCGPATSGLLLAAISRTISRGHVPSRAAFRGVVR